ncbi:hypothetical protein MSG28_008288 [Choristoneura fumiferana]|uniref:Uncharacterized protein n=1 Tax=Choristoneura fumiferana TaxID=7141 RepID=A0ACC0JAU0_CHOFU|nr:hypothetical protein MSG28_008288 [Choristoneura fumiferana]
MGKEITNNNTMEVEKKKPGIATTVEEALSYTGFGKYNFSLLLICSWTLQAMGLDLFGTSFVVAAAVCDLDLDMQKRALLTATPLAGVVAGAQLWGYFADTKVFAYPILPLEFSYPIEFLGITFRPWRLLALVLSLPCAATACLLQLFHESPKFLVSRSRYEDALKVLKSIYSCNTGKDANNFPVTKLVQDEEDQSSASQGSFFRAVWEQTAPLFRPPLLKNTLKLFYLVVVIYMTGSGFVMWLPYIMNNLFSVVESGGGEGMNLCTIIRDSTNSFVVADNSTTTTEICNDTIQKTTLLSAITYGAVASSANLVLSLTCEARKRLAMMGIIAMSASAAVLLNVVPVPIAGGVFFFMFLLCALSMGILSVYFVELYPTSVRGTASCLSVMLGRSSAFLGVNAIGAIGMAWLLPKDKVIKEYEQTKL